MAARAIWKGVLRMGSVKLPVKLYSAVQDTGIHFHLLHDHDKTRLKQRMVNADTGKTVPYGSAKKGFEVERGVFVILDEEQLRTLEPEESRDIEITRFVPGSAIDPQWYERPYFLGPDEEDETDYFAFAEALKRQKRVGIARWAMRKKSYVGALLVEGDYLMLTTLRYAGQIISTSELEPPAGRKLDKKELQLAEKLIATLEDKFDPSAYHDEYKQRVMELIDTKARGGKVQVKHYRRKAKTTSLTQMLEASLHQAG